MFIGRTDELNELKEAYQSDKFESVILYGRRRVGKTELIKESLKDYDGIVIHYECKKTSVMANLKMVAKLFCDKLNLGNLTFNNYDDFFECVMKVSLKQAFVLVIDEFSFLLEEDFSIESSIAIQIDKYNQESKMKLVISGSYVTIMEKLVEYSSHSYGRFNHILIIRPFDYFTSSMFYPNYSNEDKLKMYAVFGGIPYFNSLINPNKSVEENIIKLIVKQDSILEHELNEMILSETNKVFLLNDLISIIASGVTKYSDIKSQINQHEDVRPDYLLQKLIDMDIITKANPINDKNNPKKRRYVFADNFMEFYYHFIFNSPYSINRVNPEFFFDKFIKKDFETEYLPKAFEKISKEFILKLNTLGRINPIIMDIGSYSFDDPINKINREFDVVTKDEKGYISYECKYTNSPIGLSVLNEEEKQTKNLDIHFYKLGFISKNGFSEQVSNIKYNLFTLNDFYKF